MKALVLFSALLPAVPATAESLVAATTIRSKTVIGPEHLAVVPESVPGALRNAEDALGQEARIAIYAGRPIRSPDLGPPAVVERNQIVTLVYHSAGLAIRTEGRSLVRAAAGEAVRALNLASRSTVVGIVDRSGLVHVGPPRNPEGNR